MKYNPIIVTAFFREFGIPAPVYEYRFCNRNWAFDLAWPDSKLAVEVQGGIFINGRHTRGAALLKEWEKLNTAAMLGWRILYCQPGDLCMTDFAKTIKQSLNDQAEPQPPPNAETGQHNQER